MFSVPHHRLDRRAFLRAAAATAALLTTTSLTRVAFAEESEAEAFDYDGLSERMRLKAAEPFNAAAPELPKLFAGLDYDGYRKIQFDAQHARWIDNNSGFQVHAFPMGWLFKEPVGVFEVVDGQATPFGFSNADFMFYDKAMGEEAAAEAFPGIAGVRINYPVNVADKMDELVSFLGSSYFRALGRNNIYGLSARGLAVNSWQAGPEEFPRFSAFWLERPSEGKPLVAYASLEGPSVTGAYRFEITPASDTAQETAIDVTAQQLAVAVLIGYALSIVLLVKKRYGMAVYSLICLTLPLFAGMASVLRFTAALAPMPLMLTELLASRRWLFAVSLLVLLAGGYFTTIGWLTGYLSLV